MSQDTTLPTCELPTCSNRVKRLGKRFCSRTCFALSVRKRPLKCALPGCENGMKVGSNKFCSPKCQAEAIKKPLPICANVVCSNLVKRHGKKYCSVSCGSQTVADRQKSTRKLLVCERCKAEYTTKPAKQDSSRYCSMMCARAARSEELSARTGENHPLWAGDRNVVCRYAPCGKSFRVPEHLKGRLYCSRRCKSKDSQTTVSCVQCERFFTVPKSRGYMTFCSLKCAKGFHGDTVEGLKLTTHNFGRLQGYGVEFLINREYCLKRDKHRCRSCGAKKREIGSKALHVHHIAPFRLSRDNSLHNLVTLCNTCHRKVESGNLPCPTTTDT